MTTAFLSHHPTCVIDRLNMRKINKLKSEIWLIRIDMLLQQPIAINIQT
jgi:hypothetical protein